MRKLNGHAVRQVIIPGFFWFGFLHSFIPIICFRGKHLWLSKNISFFTQRLMATSCLQKKQFLGLSNKVFNGYYLKRELLSNTMKLCLHHVN